MYSDTPTHNVNLLIYDRLYELTKDGRVEPDLAADLPKIEENGTKYTIKIKDGVKFHNGNKLTIDDVIYSFQRGGFHEKVADEVDLRHDVRHPEGRRDDLQLPHRQARPGQGAGRAPRTPT